MIDLRANGTTPTVLFMAHRSGEAPIATVKSIDPEKIIEQAADGFL